MFRRYILALFLGALMTATGCAHTAHTPARPSVAESGLETAQRLSAVENPRVVKLQNGLTVLIKEDDRFPLVNIRLYVHAGAAFEEPGQEGISHLLEHMVFKGSEQRGPGETAREIESVGGSLNAGTSWDYTVYYVEVPDEHWRLGMDVVKDMGFGAKVDPEELEPERQVVLSELERGEDQPGSRMFKTLTSMVWEDTSYEWPIIGHRESLNSISAEDIHAYIDRLYQPQSMLLVVAGKVDEDQVLAEAEQLFGPIANTRAVTPPPSFDVPETGPGPRVAVIPGKWNKVYLAAGFPIPNSHDAETPALEVLGHLLGGDDTSLLYRTFKYEKRLVDDIGASALTLDGVGMFYISATLDADKVTPFWEELVRELAGFSPEQFTDRELARAKLNLADSLFTAKETLSGLASKLGALQFFYGSQKKEANYLFELSQVDRDVLALVAKRYLTPDKLNAVVLPPEDAGLEAEGLSTAVRTLWSGEGEEAETSLAGGEGEIEEVALPGGSTLVLLPDATLPYTALSIYWPGGDGSLTPDQQGLSALAAKVLTRGTPKMTATQIEDFLSDRAASVSAMGGRDVFALNAKFPAWFAGDLTGLITDMLTAPTWPATEADLAKQDQIANIKTREDKPLGLAFRHMFPILFTTPPYSYYHRGMPEAVAGYTSDQLKRFWLEQSSAPFVLAVCGQFDAQAMREFAANLARLLTDPSAPYEFTAPEWSANKLSTLPLPDRNQAHLLAVFPAAGTEDLRTSAGLTVLRAALAGQSGLLFRDLRDRQGLGYTVTAFLWQAPKAGFLAFYIGTEPDKVEQAEQGFRRTIETLRDAPLPTGEVARARNVIMGEYYQEHQTLLSRSRQAANLMAQGLDRNMERELVELSQELTPEELRELAERFLHWEEAYVIKVEP